MGMNKFKKTVFFTAGLALIFVFSALLISKNLKDPKIIAPIITFKEEKHDFGDVPQGPKLEGTFEFTNTGQNLLVIKNVTTSCGCTGAMVDEKKEFAPGESGKIRFTFNTEGRVGLNTKTITVDSDDPVHSKVTLTLVCNVVAGK
jgi:hypothetical protein